MKYDFTTIIDRHGKDAVAVDGIGGKHWGMEPKAAREGFDEIPMWVADMNFATAPSVTRALEARIEHPCYGYFAAAPEYYDSIIRWQTERNGYTDLKSEEIGYENGVHGGVISTIEVLTQPGDHILVHSPAYVGFLGDLKETGRYASLSPLARDGGGVWRMNFEDMEEKIQRDHIHLAIFCSPHNPTGRVWERWELERAMELFRRYDVTVISDEIWSDIIFKGHKHIPTATVSRDAADRTIALYAPSKTFNLAGLVGSYHIIRNPYLRDRIRTFGEKTHYNEMNVLSMHALIGAYSPEGAEWVGELNEVLEGNCRYAADFINERLDGCSAAMPEGTYMLFMNVREYCEKHGTTPERLLKAGWDVGVAYQDGRLFADSWSIRINCASPRARVEEAFRRLEKYVFTEG